MKNLIKNLSKNDTFKNSIWIIGERIFQAFISFILTILISRYLGPSNYGILNYGATFVSLFLVIMKLGLDNIIVNELVKNRGIEGELLGTSLFMRIISGIISIIVMLILVIILNINSKLILISSLLQSFTIIFQTFNILDYWFQSHLQSKYVSIAKSISYFIVAMYKVFLLITGKSVLWFALSNVLDSLIIAILLVLFYKKVSTQKLKVNFKLGNKLLQNSYHFIISGLMVTIYTQIDKIMIGSMIDENQLGFYSATLAVCSIWTFIPDAIITSLRPSIFELKKQNQNFLKRLKQTYALVFYLCVIFAFLIAIFSKTIINIIYGSDYAIAGKALKILIWYVPLSQLGVARGIWLVAENKGKYTKKIMFFGVITNIVLNYILIQKIGMYGAIIATLVTEFLTCFIVPLFYKETRIHTKYLIESILLKFKE